MKRLLYKIAALRFRRKPVSAPLNPKSIRRILILRYDAIGDMVVTIPMIDLLKANCTEAEIDIVCSPANYGILDGNEVVSKRVVFDRTIGGYLAVRKALRKQDYDVVISLVFNKTTLSGFLANTLGKSSAVTVSFEHPERRELYSTWYNVMFPHERGKDVMTLMQLRLASSVIGVELNKADYPLHLPVTEQGSVNAKIETSWMGSPRIALNISAGNSYRMLSEDVLLETMKLIIGRLPSCSILIISHGERREMASRLAQAFSTHSKSLSALSFLKVSEVLREVDLLISPDTSLIHAAAAVGTPVVGLYTQRATFIHEWMPYGVEYTTVVTPGRTDLTTLSPREITDATLSLIDTLSKVKL